MVVSTWDTTTDTDTTTKQNTNFVPFAFVFYFIAICVKCKQRGTTAKRPCFGVHMLFANTTTKKGFKPFFWYVCICDGRTMVATLGQRTPPPNKKNNLCSNATGKRLYKNRAKQTDNENKINWICFLFELYFIRICNEFVLNLSIVDVWTQ